MVTCQAPVNIAVIKYCKCAPSGWQRNDAFYFYRVKVRGANTHACVLSLETVTVRTPTPFQFQFALLVSPGGKRDEKLILPYNDSISGTLDMDQVSTVRFSVQTYTRMQQ